MCYWFDDDLVDEFEAATSEYFGFLKDSAKTIGGVARQVAPIAKAIPIPQAQLIGGVAGLMGNLLAEVMDAFADEWRART